MNPENILKQAHFEARKTISENKSEEFDIFIREDVDFMIEEIDRNKSLVSALVTSLVKKIMNPEQDVRLHRADFENGYSARVLDTKFITPFFKNHFPKYANKESAFLTLATRERIIWNRDEGKNLKIRNKKLKKCFLNIFEQIEVNKKDPKVYLCYIFLKLEKLTSENDLVFQSAKNQNERLATLNINMIIEMLQNHFSERLSSRLPVIAIYSIYEIIVPNLKRYENKKLLPLQVHTTSDKHGFGDIEIYSIDDKPFEVVEIKHNIPIDKYLIFDIVKKTELADIDRYYILTTFQNGFKSKAIEKSVNEFTMQIKTQKGIDIIANGIIPTLKYYLRFVNDYKSFTRNYTNNLINDARNSTEVKTFHIDIWINLLKEYGVDDF